MGYVPVAKHVDYEMVTKVKAANLQGVGQQETSKRIYPQGTMAAQVLGFVNGEGVGSGIEGSMNERLSGKDGLLKTVTDVNSIPLSIGDDNIEVKAQNGEDIVLTIDENVQRKAETVLKSNVEGSNGVVRNASVVILNPNNGQVMAMANYPTYNPEEYYKVTDASVFTNRVTELAYEPASVCKPFYALDAAQARGILYIPPQVDVYMGMIVGLSKKDELDINVCREKQLTNMRTHASDGAIQLTPYTQLSLEQCLDFLMEDELLEVTPKSLRLRKRDLDPIVRKRKRNHMM